MNRPLAVDSREPGPPSTLGVPRRDHTEDRPRAMTTAIDPYDLIAPSHYGTKGGAARRLDAAPRGGARPIALPSELKPPKTNRGEIGGE